ncbi:MAG: AAA family ATPase [Cetobacterium sp.]
MNYLVQFSVENFLSFNGKQTFALFNSADESLNKYLLKIPNEKFTLSPVAAIYGNNSSGKTNLLKAIGFLKFLLNTSSNKKINEKIPFLPFKLSQDKPTTFEVIFISEGIRYGYLVSFNQEKIIKEALYTYPNGKIKKIFERILDDNKNYIYSYSRDYQSNFKDIEIKSLQNKLFLSTLSEWSTNEDIKNSIVFFLDKIVMNIDYENPNWQHFTAEQLENNLQLKKLFLKLLKEINPGIKDISSKVIRKKMSMEELPSEIPLELRMFMTNEETISTDIKIEYNKKGLILDLSEESRGIKKLFEIGGPLLSILLNGQVLIFDELETSLHPLLAKKIIELFLDPVYNKKGAQLIFTTHDTNLLDLDFIRRDQIWITEKGIETDYATYLTCLSNIKGIRKDENIRKGFLQGKYTKIPFLTGKFLNKDFYGDE